MSMLRRLPLAYLVLAGLIVVLALGVRLFGHDWDDGLYLHPDERFIAFVITDRIHAPDLDDLGAILDPEQSPLNPRSDGPDDRPRSYAYGSLPLFVTDAVAAAAGAVAGRDLNSYAAIVPVGRYLGAILDAATIVLAMAVARRTWGRAAALLSGLLLAGSVILIQLAHFFTVDTWVTCLATLTVLAATRIPHSTTPRWSIIAGAALGAALATKVSVVTLALPIITAALLDMRREYWRAGLRLALKRLSIVAGSAIAAFAVLEPYALWRPRAFFGDVLIQWRITSGRLDLPFTRQYVGTTPVLYEVEQLVRWGIGPAFGLAAIVAVGWALRQAIHRRAPAGAIVLLTWVIPYFALIAVSEVKFLRYSAPIVPALAILVGGMLGPRIAAARGRWTVRRVAVAGAAALVVGATLAWAVAFLAIYTQPHTRVAASEWIYDHVPPGSTITAEYWDDALPLILPDRPLPGVTYQQLTLDLYRDRSNQDAFDYIASSLEQANYVILSSDRLADSIPRLPWRYPVAAEYYDRLERGELGFQLVYESDNVPRLGPLRFDDRAADESFTVYDHPRVRIYEKVEQLSRADLELRFADGLAQPWEPTREPSRPTLLLDRPVDERPAAHDLGWSAGWTDSGLSATLWWLTVVTLIGIGAFPVSALMFGRFSDMGWGLSRLLGLLICGYAVWILVSLGPARNTLGWIVPVLAAVVVTVWIAAWRRLPWLIDRLRVNRGGVLASELAFLLGFAVFLLIRASNPDLWQATFGGEKPMETSYIAAIARSAVFPPMDPWFAGGSMNYYYYGFYLVAVLWKLTGIPPEIAFQLSMATVSGLLVAGMFSLAGTLVRDLLGARRLRGIVGGGALGVLVYVVIGNLDPLIQLLTGQSPANVDFWRSSRVIDYAITEFPYFTQLYGDLHPHAIALPMTVLLLALAYVAIAGIEHRLLWGAVTTLVVGSIIVTNSWDAPLTIAVLFAGLISGAFRVKQGRARRLVWAAAGGVAVTIGAVALFLPFLARFVPMVGGIAPTTSGTAPAQYVLHFGIFLIVLGASGVAWLVGATPRARRRWNESLIAGLAVIAGFAASSLLGVEGGWPRNRSLLLAAVVLAGFLWALWKLSNAYDLPGWLRGASAAAVGLGVGALAGPRPTAAALWAVAGVGALVWLAGLLRGRAGLVVTGICLAGAPAVSIATDIVYIADDLRGTPWERMNTVFKLSLQSWTLYAIATTLALAWLIRTVVATPNVSTLHIVAKHPAAPAERERASYAPAVALGIATMAVACGLLYPIFATPVRLAQRMPGSPTGLTLDGLAWMDGSYVMTAQGERVDFTGDLAAIRWLRDHATHNDVILEASIGPYRGNGSRITAGTGLPTVLGWDHHERQQRYTPAIDQRLRDVRLLYTTPDTDLKRRLIRTYRVHYVIVGDVERYWRVQPPFAGATRPDEPYATAAGLNAFDQMVGADLRVAFRSGNTTIYEVAPFPSLDPAPRA